LGAVAGGLRLEHDDQVTDGVCGHCGAPYESVIGVIYEDDDAIAIYRADIFDRFHRDPEPRVSLSIAVGEWQDGTDRSDRCSAAIEAWAEGARVRMAFSDRAGSPWQDLEVVSWQLTSKEAAASPLKDEFLRLADYVARNDRRLRKVLKSRTTAPPSM
jgi:hypothetical protein